MKFPLYIGVALFSLGSVAIARQDFRTYQRQPGPSFINDYTARVSLGAGVTTLNAADKSIDHVDYSIYGGAALDVNSTFIGGDIDVYYGSASAVRNQNSQLKEGGLSQYGGLAAFRGQLPFYTGSVHWIPKVGIGYGLMKLSLHEETTGLVKILSDQIATGAQVSGLFYLVGLEVKPFSFLMLSGDYAQSLTASGSVDVNVGLKFDNSSDQSGFDRVRVAANLRILPRTWLGAQFIQRKISTGLAKGLLNNDLLSTGQRHFLINAIFETP